MARLVFILIALLLNACTDNEEAQIQDESLADQIRRQGELIVVTRNGPTTYYQGPDGPMGLEYDLAQRFAKYLGVKLKLIISDDLEDIIPMIVRGEAHIAAAGLTVTAERKKVVRFGIDYQKISEHLVYRTGHKRPRSLKYIRPGQLEVTAGSSHAEKLHDWRLKIKGLQWKENKQTSSDELLNLVYEQVIDYTIVDSNELSLFQRYHKEVKSAFTLGKAIPLGWALAYSSDDSLMKEVNNFFRKLKQNGKLTQLIERYYGHADQLNFVGTRWYMRHVKTRLPEYQDYFEKMAKAYQLDWRLLAAIGYQESHWKADARSPTGVRGIMMLTLPTARQLAIKNRLDPKQSIEGGARYFRQILNRIDDSIQEPDKTWMALAAYNVGYYHLQDARLLATKLGKNPDRWIEVKKTLPLLTQKKWYKQTRYGYARGNEPVNYVENIRIYYDLLVWYTNRERSRELKPIMTLPDVDSSVF